MHSQRHNLILAAVLVAIGVFLFVWLCPYLKIFGHEKLCIGLYAVLLIAYLYFRSSAPRRPTSPARSR